MKIALNLKKKKKMDENKIKKIKELCSKYNYRARVYAHYPHKDFWNMDFNEDDYKKSLLQLKDKNKDSSAMLYVHIPFCKIQCFYCCCHTCIPEDYKEIRNYLDYLFKEFDLLHDFFKENSINPNIREIHIGGGSPTILTKDDFNALIEKIGTIVDLKNIREFSLEIDPRFIDKDKLKYYSTKGINRVSFGIQDFDPDVQKAINRVQPPEILEKILTPDVRNYFSHGINFDMLCGLPNQTVESTKRTFETLLKFSPDRVCFSYLGFFPKHAKHQLIMIDGKNGRPTKLPDYIETKMIFLKGTEMLMNSGYTRTGYDHFAKSTDNLTESLKKGKMTWNSLGVTTGDYSNTIAVGGNATGTIGNAYSQDLYYKEGYIEELEKGKLPVYRGYVLNEDDLKRREVIQLIRNYGKINYHELGEKLNIDFKEYFKEEIMSLKEFADDGILIYDENGFEITEIGMEFILYVCMKFDNFLKNNEPFASDN
jgi:oxygen-independent coproporphyrinogen III oxidase